MWYEDNFDLNDQSIRTRRKEGLPYIARKKHIYINLQDWFDFHSGKIGTPPKKFKWKDNVKEIFEAEGEDYE